jgi:hypothetical protein
MWYEFGRVLSLATHGTIVLTYGLAAIFPPQVPVSFEDVTANFEGERAYPPWNTLHLIAASF